MADLFMFEKPLGMRDTLPDLFGVKEKMRRNMMAETLKWGYRFLETPSLEYYETVGKVSATMDRQLFKLLDRDGHHLVLRPDMTAPIARVAASHLLKKGNPLRLAYSANVYRAQEREGDRPAEFEQFGIEFVGDQTVSADAEVISLLINVLKKAGIEHYHITIGHIGFVQTLLLQIAGNEERAGSLRRFLYEKNYVGFREYIKSLPFSSIDRRILFKLLELKGGRDVIELAEEMTEEEIGQSALNELKELAEILEQMGEDEYISFDLSLVSHMNYYTGVIFEVFSGEIGFPLGNGGRYNELYKQFGPDVPATGFGLRLDRLIEALGSIEPESSMICIIYSSINQQKAINQAKLYREQGKPVVVQDMNGISSLDTFTKDFKQVEFMIGSISELEAEQ